MSGPTVRLDARAVLPIAALGVVILVVIFVELCGREDIEPIEGPNAVVATATAGATFTPGPSPTAGLETATVTGEAPIGGGEERDAQRVLDLVAVQAALEEYRAENDEYPPTGGNIQTLCAFEEADAGCELRDFLDPLPIDPLGDPAANGYFYASNGDEYVLYALREGGEIEECGEHPDHLESLDSLYCVRG